MDINDTVNNLFDFYNTFNPFQIAEHLEIIIVEEPLGAIKGYYNQILGSKQIHLSSELNYEEKRFICAHELGHAIIHPELSSMYSVFLNNRFEWQANVFACTLLLRDAQRNYPERGIYELGRCAGIPLILLEKLEDEISVLSKKLVFQ